MASPKLEVFFIGNSTHCAACGTAFDIHWNPEDQVLSIACPEETCAQYDREEVWPGGNIHLVPSMHVTTQRTLELEAAES